MSSDLSDPSRSLQLLEVAECGLALEESSALFPGKTLLAWVFLCCSGFLPGFGLFLGWSRHGLLRLSEHVCKAELAHAIAVRDVTVSPAQLALRLKDGDAENAAVTNLQNATREAS